MLRSSARKAPSKDRGGIRISWIIGLIAIGVVAAVAAIYGTHAFTILGRLGLAL